MHTQNLHTRALPQKAKCHQWFEGRNGLLVPASPSILVIDLTEPNPAATACAWGISPPEYRRLDEALRRLSRRPAAFISLEAHEQGEAKVRALARKLKNHIALWQRRAGMRSVYWVEVLEGEPHFHSHVVVTMPTLEGVLALIASVERSSEFGRNIEESKPVDDWRGLRNYLLKEASPQTHCAARREFPRKLGSHSLGESVGDRVRLSPDLKTGLIQQGRIEPYRETYAKIPRRTAAPLAGNTTGAPLSTLTRAAFIQPVQLAFDLRIPELIDLFKLVEAKRISTGMSQRQAASILGIRQPHYSNSVVRGHDRLSPWHMNRAREFVAERLAA